MFIMGARRTLAPLMTSVPMATPYCSMRFVSQLAATVRGAGKAVVLHSNASRPILQIEFRDAQTRVGWNAAGVRGWLNAVHHGDLFVEGHLGEE